MPHAMQAKQAADSRGQHEQHNLDRRYGKIGIPAVAAAVRYQSEAKNPAYAPAEPRAQARHEDMAA
jgi:hypothetical protein